MIRLPSHILKIVRDGGTVVVPSRQRAHAATLAFAAERLGAGQRVWSTPDILTFEAWMLREVDQLASDSSRRLPRLLSPAEDWLLWRQCTAEATIDLELLNRGSLAESLRRASATAVQFGIDLSRLAALAGAEAELLGRTQKLVDERCRALGAATVQSLIGSLRELRGPGRLHCAGFLEHSPLLRSMGATACPPSGSSARPAVVTATDEADELERIARWCKQQVDSKPDARLWVILAGSPGRRERLATLIRQAVDPAGWLALRDEADDLVAIEGGTPLSELPVVAHALSALRYLCGLPADFSQVSEWLRAPYWDAPGEGQRARLDLWLRESGHLSIRGPEWVALLKAAPAPVAGAGGALELARLFTSGLQALGGGAVSPREWSERFRAALAALRWPGERVRSSAEQQTVVRLHELLDEFGQLASSARSMSRDEAIHWFIELASRTAYRPADNDAVVTISATFADPIVQYDGIWVAGLHAEAFPQPVQPDPFLPLAAQVAAGVPAASAGGRLAEARALLAAWRVATSELVLSAPARAEDLELLPSPLLWEWTSRKSDPAPAGQLLLPLAGPVDSATLPWLAVRLHRPDMIETLDDRGGVPWPPDQSLPAGTRSLELQNLCAFRAYSELRLGTSELGAPEPGVAPDERGKLLHAALHILWKQLRDSVALSGHTEPTLNELIERSVAQAADDLFGAPADGHRSALLVRECRRTVRLIRKLCALERTRAAFRVENTEFERRLILAGARMQVRIDRLDVLESGGRAILDYKSGRRSAADWYGERPSHPQLLAYLAAVGEGVVAMATVNVTAREVRFDGIASSGALLPKVRGVQGPEGNTSATPWELRRAQWLACIERLAHSFLAGRAEVDPKPNACEYCHAIGVCRISDRGIETAAETRTEEYDRNGQ